MFVIKNGGQPNKKYSDRSVERKRDRNKERKRKREREREREYLFMLPLALLYPAIRTPLLFAKCSSCLPIQVLGRYS